MLRCMSRNRKSEVGRESVISAADRIFPIYVCLLSNLLSKEELSPGRGDFRLLRKRGGRVISHKQRVELSIVRNDSRSQA